VKISRPVVSRTGLSNSTPESGFVKYPASCESEEVMHKLISDSARYRQYIEGRDRVLEKMLLNAQVNASVTLHSALSRVEEIISLQYHRLAAEGFFSFQVQKILDEIDRRVSEEFGWTAVKLVSQRMKFRRVTYLFTLSSEAEAIAQASGKTTHHKVDHRALDNAVTGFNPEDEGLLDRTRIILNRVRREIMDAVELSRVLQEPVLDALARVKRAFPEAKIVRRPKKELKPFKAFSEAGRDPAVSKKFLVTDFLGEGDWQDIESEYKKNELPRSRFANEEPLSGIGEDKKYAGEYEQDLTHDFVDKVRSAQSEAANQAGIKDFVWIEIIDDKTDECCLARGGMTTAEIEAAVKAGTFGDDDEGALVPPAHFNCRCRLAPIGDTVERPEPDWGTADDWIEQRVK
jgi:hypothetical protein